MVYRGKQNPHTFTPVVKDKVAKIINPKVENLNVGARGGGYSSAMTDSKDKILQSMERDLQDKGNDLITPGGSDGFQFSSMGSIQTAGAELPEKTESESDNLEQDLDGSNTTGSDDPKGGAYGSWDGKGSIPVDHFDQFRTDQAFVQTGYGDIGATKIDNSNRAGYAYSIPNYIGSDKSIIKPGPPVESKTQWVIAPASEIGDIQGAYDKQSFAEYQNVLQKHWYDRDVNQSTYKSIVKNITDNKKLTESQKRKLLRQQEKKKKQYEKFSFWDSSPETTSKQNSEVFGPPTAAVYNGSEYGSMIYMTQTWQPPKKNGTNKMINEYQNLGNKV